MPYDARAAQLRRAEKSLIKAITLPALDDADLNRALAWCSREWDASTAKLAEAVLERLERNPLDHHAATTVANFLIRAAEAHMASSNWSANYAVAAPDTALTDRYGETLRSAAALLQRAAVDDGDHHGAHYSLALLLKMYPTLVAASAEPAAAAAAAAGHLCASQRSTIDSLRPPENAAGPAAGAAASLCGEVLLVDDWAAADYVTLLDVSSADAEVRALSAKVGDVWRDDDDVVLSVAVVRPPQANDSLYIQGMDALVHDLPLFEDKSGGGLARRSVQPQVPRISQEKCHVYTASSSGCYPALWRQFGHFAGGLAHSTAPDGETEITLPRVAFIDGFSGASYYHWLVECVPRMLLLADAVRKYKEPPVTLFVPNGPPFIEETLRLLPQDTFAAFTVLRRRDPGTKIRADVVYVPHWTGAPRGVDGAAAAERSVLRRGGGAALCPPRNLLLRVRAAFLGGLDGAAAAPQQTKLVLVSRGAGEARALGNEEAIRLALLHVARQHLLDFVVFDGRSSSMTETLHLFRTAALVVGVHGAGLANAIFCGRGAAMLELALPEPEFAEYRHLAQSLDLRYAASFLPPSNFEARAWPRPSEVASAAEKLLSGARQEALY